MSSDLRIVLDANVVVSALLIADSNPRRAFERASSRGRILVSADYVAELSEVLHRSKFDRYVPEDVRLDYLAELINLAELVAVTTKIDICRDPKDDHLLELAVSGAATHLITGDADLLTLNPFQGIGIVTPSVFLTSFTE